METNDVKSACGGGLTPYAREAVDAVILANGEYPWHAAARYVLAHAPYVVCCDGACEAYFAEGLRPDAIVGDGDSISPATRARCQAIFHHVPEQSSNDQSKALAFLLEQGRRSVAVVGGCGKREDHTIANVGLLMKYLRAGKTVNSFSNYGVFLPSRGSRRFYSYPGQQVSVFNFTARALSGDGLLYPLYAFEQWYQGTLNEACASEFMIRADGDYLVYLNY